MKAQRVYAVQDQEVIQGHPELRVWVVRNKTASLSVLAVLAADDDPAVRCAVAMKRKIDAAIFERLADDPDPSVRRRAALNPKCPPQLLYRISPDLSRSRRGVSPRKRGGCAAPGVSTAS
jgi:hypothetical protein